MRIVSGKFKGRRFSPPANLKARPTTDIAKEGLFNILNNMVDFEEVCVLDMFAGTGSISFEFVSRGCGSVVAVEQNRVNFSFMQKVMSELGIDEITAIKGDTFKFVGSTGSKFDKVFADPPYDLPELDTIPDLIFGKELLKEDGFLVLEHPRTKDFSGHPRFFDHRCYGHVNFSFFK